MSSCTLIEETDLTRAWARLLLAVRSDPPDPLAPLVVSITGYQDGQPAEDATLRGQLDEVLAANNMPQTSESASTIFPYRSWIRRGRSPRMEFFDWYLTKRLPRLRARSKKNVYGTYFERMIGFSSEHKPNQLDDIISQWTKRVSAGSPRPRRSAMQAVIVDPLRDLTGQALRGFPCLHQVSFTYDNDGGLAVNAYYPSQYVVDRAYGNYLGLGHLGTFMAHELGVSMVRLNCFIAHVSIGTVPVGALAGILTSAKALVAEQK